MITKVYKYEVTKTKVYYYEIAAHSEEEAFKKLESEEADGQKEIDSVTEYKGCVEVDGDEDYDTARDIEAEGHNKEVAENSETMNG